MKIMIFKDLKNYFILDGLYLKSKNRILKQFCFKILGAFLPI